MPSINPGTLVIDLHPRQMEVLKCPANEIFWGGSKSFLARALAIILCVELPEFSAFLFRRTFREIIDVHMNNPGGPHHHYYKGNFVDLGEFRVVRMSQEAGGMKRVFIPDRLEDNPDMLRNDPDYEAPVILPEDHQNGWARLEDGKNR